MGNECALMFRCIFLPGDLFWIIASDTAHILRMAFVPKTKGKWESTFVSCSQRFI